VISYAQNFEDVLLDRCFRNISNGFYVDVGAWDPIVDSVTHHFYVKGWNGINIEPDPEFYERLRIARPRDTNLKLAIGDLENTTQSFTSMAGGGISTLRTLSTAYLSNLESRGYLPRLIDVPLTTLANVCREYVGTDVQIDFLKVDVEGWEEQALRGHDWDRWRPKVVVVESVTPVSCDESGRDVYADLSSVWEHVLLDNGYIFALNDGINGFYVRRESPDLLEHLRVPVNCLDQAIHRSFFEDRQELAQARQELERLELQVEADERLLLATQGELNGANAELSAQRQRVESLTSSTSWRLTAPFRSVSDRLRSRIRGKDNSGNPHPETRAQGINVIGHFADSSGLAEATRSTVRCIERAGLPMRTLETGPPRVPPGEIRNDVASSDHSMPYEVSVIHDNIAHAGEQPSVYSVGAGLHPYVIGYWYWELHNVPSPFGANFDLVDEVWVPTTFVHDALQPHTEKPVTVVPPSIELNVAAPMERAALNLPNDRFLFLTMASVHSVLERKNPLGVVDAFETAFGDTDDVGLVVKITDLQHRPDVADKLDEAARRIPLFVLEEKLTRPDTLGLVQTIDAYVSLHRSEGFGLPIVEAMAMGKPVVATGYSGNMDVTGSDTAFLVRYDLVDLAESYSVYPAGSQWAEPDLESAATQMRTVVFDEGRRTQIARAGQARVRDRCDPRVGAAVITDRMGAIAGRRVERA
jgi:FkbM family methyltransferase